MKFGINLINFGPGANPESLYRSVHLAEALGYHLVMTSDHIAVTPDVNTRYPAPFYEPLTTLGWLAAATQRMEIGTTVIIVPYRSPLETAKALANVDQLSGGRLIFGVGVGWAQDEFEALRVPFHRRGAVTDEYLEAIKVLWSQDIASYQGEFVSFENVNSAPRPVRTPHPPIWVGGPSDAAMRRAVRYGDAWHPIRIRVDDLRDRDIPRLREIAEREQRPMPDLCPRVRLRITDAPMSEELRLAGEGNLDQVRRDLAELESLGCTYVLLDTFFDDVEATTHHETSWRMMATAADRVVDLQNQTVRG